ncbi:DUF2987 domain-containing protein [Psychrobium sp. MM17-31]|uniref:DUF2987 domain-containing protein n=1 Tax=Psychrobium sp. MM17-31 TaxID=2917758 RepID=UPI001EF646ED|nr:DUF2987 domain-containing protein [Psychrobium sp. MM17-31]MCG7531572.1 DUF2987 domain-containing protein [Psychrobium sp. MM17-31]
MMCKTLAATSVALLFAFSPISNAQQTKNSSQDLKETAFTYAGLYKSLKTSKKSEFSQLKLNFVLKQTGKDAVCPTDAVYLGDGEKQYQVLTDKHGALLLPLDKSLKQDHAAIRFKTKSEITCHLSMKISVAEFELEDVTAKNVKSWLGQFKDLYSTLAGWPGRYFMPEVAALSLSFDKAVSLKITQGENVLVNEQGNDVSLTTNVIETLAEDAKIYFNGKLISVTPVLAK